MQTCNRFDDYFNCAEHCAGCHAAASDDLPAYMYAEDNSPELVNPWDAPVPSLPPLGFVPSGVAAWQPVAVTAYSVSLEEQHRDHNQNNGLAALELEYPAMPMMGDNFDMEYPAMSTASLDLALDLEYPAMPMIPATHEQPDALQLEHPALLELEYPPMPMMAPDQYGLNLEQPGLPLVPPGLGLEAQYDYPALHYPMHGLEASIWTPTRAERAASGIDARLVPFDAISPRRIPIAGLGFEFSDILELRRTETLLEEYQVALTFARASAEFDESDETTMTDDSEEPSSLETDESTDMDIDDDYVYDTIKAEVRRYRSFAEKWESQYLPGLAFAMSQPAGGNSGKQMQELLTALKNDKIAWPFQQPVNADEVIKNPLDFSLIEDKLEHHRYATLDEFIADCRLIFSNCLGYNPEDTLYAKCALKMHAARAGAVGRSAYCTHVHSRRSPLRWVRTKDVGRAEVVAALRPVEADRGTAEGGSAQHMAGAPAMTRAFGGIRANAFSARSGPATAGG
ncbi:Bromodomain-domain-containing protein [Auricularia subglabra TFB-10046 SS5]|nr:Bromodomain-domain-containing protein [Auricularia subglabra TFB-10046 SS5]